MSLEMQNSSSEALSRKDKDEKLAAYLSGALKAIGTKKGYQAESAVAEFAQNADVAGLDSKDVKAKQREVSKEMKGYSFKDKLAYMATSRAPADVEAGKALNVAALFGFAIGGIAVAAGEASPEAVALTSTGFAYLASKAVLHYVGEKQEKDPKPSVQEYTELKHTQLALRQLKKRLDAPKKEAYLNEVKKLYASFGNPGGGFIHNAFKDKQGGR